MAVVLFFIILFARAYARTRVINKVYPIAFSLSGKRDIGALHHKKGDFIKGIGATWIEKIVSKHSTYQKQTLLLRQNIADEMATAILKQ